MRKLIKLVGFAVGAGAVAWLMKDRLVPAPEGPTEEPPTFRVPPQPAPEPVTPDAEAAPADDLSEVKGIGPVYSRRLSEAGITTFAQLASTEPATVAAAAEVSEELASDWTDQAAVLARGE